MVFEIRFYNKMTTIWFSKLDSEKKDWEENSFQPAENHTAPLIGKPKEVGCFSIDADRRICFNKSQMKYLVSPLRTRGLRFDLNHNIYSDVVHKYVTIEKIYQMLYWLINNKEQLQNPHPMDGDQTSTVDFVTVRGTLALISCTPYLKGFYRDQWEICASKFKGTIYFSAIDTDKDIDDNENMSWKQSLLQSWGYKFEQYMTVDNVGGQPDISNKSHQLEEFCIVLRNILNKYCLLYKAEIDAVVPFRYPAPGSGDTSCYTELKTSRVIQTENQNFVLHKYKMVMWWVQSFLAGIPEVICGMRDDVGIVKNLRIFRVSNMPIESQGLWSSDACLQFCDKFLTFLKKTVREDDPNIVYKFQYKGDNIINCQKLINPEPRYRVIPEWFERSMQDD